MAVTSSLQQLLLFFKIVFKQYLKLIRKQKANQTKAFFFFLCTRLNPDHAHILKIKTSKT